MDPSRQARPCYHYKIPPLLHCEPSIIEEDGSPQIAYSGQQQFSNYQVSHGDSQRHPKKNGIEPLFRNESPEDLSQSMVETLKNTSK